MKVKIKKSGFKTNVNLIIKKISYFLVVIFLTIFLISFSQKNQNFLENAKLQILSTLKPFFVVSKAPFFLLQKNETEYFEEQNLKLQIKLYQILTEKENLAIREIKNFKNSIIDLKFNNYNLIIFSPKYYSTNGFLKDVIFASNIEGVEVNSAVISEKGLFGRVTEVRKNQISIISIFSSFSRIPVYTKSSKVYGIASGDGFEISFLYPNMETEKIIENEEVFTSGENDLIISEIPFGKIQKIDGKFKIIPFSKSRPQILGIIKTQ